MYTRRVRMSGKGRKKKQIRVNRPEPIVLQPRDEKIIHKVYEFGFLTREQIQRIFNFNCTVRANIRLRKLFDHGYLSRRFAPTIRGSRRAIYFLGSKGVQVVSQLSGTDPLETREIQRKSFEKKDLFFNHDILVNDVRISFDQAMNGSDSFKLDQWMTPADCIHEYTIFNPALNQEIKKVFKPDAYFRYISRGKLFNCFLEVDRSTMSNSRFESKVLSYLEYAQSGLYQHRYGFKFFRVLVVTKTRERLLNLKSTTGRLTDKIFWFATLDNIIPHRMLNSIWERPRSDKTFSLLEG
jgi:hypothetical protein